jgi:AcrR family transcriptional regulator
MSRLKGPERREQLLTVATKLFADKGYEATTTASIAEAAGITEPVLYRHFDNKKDLYLAVLRNSSELLAQRWRDAANQAEQAPEQVRHLATTIYGSLPEISNHQRVIYLSVTCNSDPDIAAFLHEHVDRLINQAMTIVKLGQQQGVFRQDMDLYAMSWAIVNIYTGFSFTRLHVNPAHMDLRVVVEVVLTGLYARS